MAKRSYPDDVLRAGAKQIVAGFDGLDIVNSVHNNVLDKVNSLCDALVRLKKSLPKEQKVNRMLVDDAFDYLTRLNQCLRGIRQEEML